MEKVQRCEAAKKKFYMPRMSSSRMKSDIIRLLMPLLHIKVILPRAHFAADERNGYFDDGEIAVRDDGLMKEITHTYQLQLADLKYHSPRQPYTRVLMFS